MTRRVAALGGHLVVDSRPAQGTTISFEIDLRRGPAAGARSLQP
jgi:signal transduction histidine kinase